MKRTVVSSNPGGEEGEELRAALPYKGKGKAYHDRKGYAKGEYAAKGEWSSDTDAPHGHYFSSSKTRKIIARAKRQKAQPLKPGTEVTGMGSAENASVEDLAKRAGAHGRSQETHGGLSKGSPEYHKAAVSAAKAGTHKPSIVAKTGINTVAMVGGRTSMRHHQLAGVDPKVTSVSRKDVYRAARSATRRDAAERSGKLNLIRNKLAAKGRTMRECYERILALLIKG